MCSSDLRVPSICDYDLTVNGYVDADGNPIQPETYKSDSVWSYELGAKSRLLDGRLTLDGSVYRVEWKDIQANVSLPNCAYNFVDNLADATSEGFDLAVQFMLTEQLTLSGAYGYNNPRFDRDALSPGGRKIFSKGAGIPNAGSPQTLSLTGEYTTTIAGYESYARLDYTYSAQWRRVGNQSPAAPFFDPRLKPTNAYEIVNLRVGARVKDYDVSLFVQNLTDETALLNLSASSYYDPQDWTNQALRPRSVGVMVTWRQ